MHALMLAGFTGQISALPPAVTSIAELTEAVRAKRAEQGPDAWVQGWGYDEALLAERRSPTRWDLDAGCDDAPVCILRTCGHIRCVNSRALELAGITRDTPDPAGGQIERDADGEPTGVLKENARDLVNRLIPHASREDDVANLLALGRLMASQGIVAATDMCTLDGTDAVPVIEAAVKAGFAQDIASYVLWGYVKDDPSYTIAPERRDRGAQAFCAGIKLLTDGSVSGRTAWFDVPYRGAEGDEEAACGFPTCTDEELEGAIAFCRENRCQLSLHAMGTRAIDRAVGRLAQEEPWSDGSWPYARVEHVTAPSPSAVETFARTGIAVVTQPIFPYAEIGTYRANLGDERTRACYPLRSLLDAGVTMCISTDAPATSWAVPVRPLPQPQVRRRPARIRRLRFRGRRAAGYRGGARALHPRGRADRRVRGAGHAARRLQGELRRAGPRHPRHPRRRARPGAGVRDLDPRRAGLPARLRPPRGAAEAPQRPPRTAHGKTAATREVSGRRRCMEGRTVTPGAAGPVRRALDGKRA